MGLSRAQDRLVVVSSTAMWKAREGLPLHRVLREISEMEAAGEDAAIVLSGRLHEGSHDA